MVRYVHQLNQLIPPLHPGHTEAASHCKYRVRLRGILRGAQDTSGGYQSPVRQSLCGGGPDGHERGCKCGAHAGPEFYRRTGWAQDYTVKLGCSMSILLRKKGA